MMKNNNNFNMYVLMLFLMFIRLSNCCYLFVYSVISIRVIHLYQLVDILLLLILHIYRLLHLHLSITIIIIIVINNIFLFLILWLVYDGFISDHN